MRTETGCGSFFAAAVTFLTASVFVEARVFGMLRPLLSPAHLSPFLTTSMRFIRTSTLDVVGVPGQWALRPPPTSARLALRARHPRQAVVLTQEVVQAAQSAWPQVAAAHGSRAREQLLEMHRRVNRDPRRRRGERDEHVPA